MLKIYNGIFCSLFVGILMGCAATPSVLMSPIEIKPKIALVLGGGAAKGFAHVGVIKMLEAHGITPEIIVGTSAGSVVGSLYASGLTGFQLQELAFSLDTNTIRDMTLSSNGLLKGEKLQNYINYLVKGVPIEKLNKPFGAVATDLETGRVILFQRGNTGQAVRASSSIPGVFQPTWIAGKRYVDGGVVSPVPVASAKKMGADFIIAVDISSKASQQVANGALGVIYQSITIMGEKINDSEIKQADIILRPRVGKIGGADFDQRHVAILEGEKIALAALPEIKRQLQAKTLLLNAIKENPKPKSTWFW